MVCIYGVLEFCAWQFGWPAPFDGYRLDYLPQFGVLAILAMTGVALGLLLSSCVSSPDQANALLPYVLIPQIILGGGILPIKDGPLYVLAELLSPAYWAYRAVQRGATTLPQDLPWHMDYNDSVWIACVALVVQTVVLLLLTVIFLRAKDLRKT
jgi:ABC-type transport system involved in multi-copper enzyme maturation permease subunit